MILVAGIVLSGLVAVAWIGHRSTLEETEFERSSEDLAWRVANSMETYIDDLSDLAAVTVLDGRVDPDRFTRGVALTDLAERYPGIDALTLVEAVGPGGGPALDRELRPVVTHVVDLGSPLLTPGTDLSRFENMSAQLAAASTSDTPVLLGMGQVMIELSEDPVLDRTIDPAEVDALGWCLAIPLPDQDAWVISQFGLGAGLVVPESADADDVVITLESPESGQVLTGSREQPENLQRRWSSQFDANGLDIVVAVGDEGPDGYGTHPGLLFAIGVTGTVLLASLVATRGRLRHTADSLDAVRYEADHDSLTGLGSRSSLIVQLEAALRRRPQTGLGVAVLFCDMDRFKVVNDSMGHRTGDGLLQRVAERLREADENLHITRFGGDEFVMICEHIASEAGALAVARGISDALSEPITFDGVDHVVSMSIGIAIAGADDPADTETLIRDADSAMYRAKDQGGGKAIVFDEALRSATVNRLEVEQELRRALVDEQLAVHYQAILDMSSHRVTSVEALVRWQHPEHGLVSPGAFIPIAEETGLVVDIGWFVLDTACAQLARWHQERPDLVLHVNIAGRQLMSPDFIERVTDILETHWVPADRLVIEVLEGVVLDPHGEVNRILGAVAELGIGVALDDFGSGLSSLGRIRELTMVDHVKIDRALVAGVHEDPADEAIIGAVAAMCHAIGMSVTAEGVEEMDEARVLERLGIDHAQGFLFSRPRASADLVWYDIEATFDRTEFLQATVAEPVRSVRQPLTTAIPTEGHPSLN